MSDSPNAVKPIPNRRFAIQRILLVAFVLLILLSAVVGGLTLLFVFYVPTPFVFAYVAYLALKIRRGFVVQLYRNQALGIAAIAAYLTAQAGISFLLPSPANSSYAETLAWALTNLAGGVPFFLWIDATARVARKSDPYERDSLNWSKLRYVVIVVAIVSAALGLVIAPTVVASFGSYVPSYSLLANIVGNVPFAAILLAGLAILSLGAIRSKDITLRRHIFWLAVFFFTFIITFAVTVIYTLLVPSASGGQYTTFEFAADVLLYYLAAYCLYRSARSLAPHTNHL